MSKANGLLSKATCLRRYQEGLAQFAIPGNRNFMVTKGACDFVNMGKGAGLSADQIKADAHAVGVFDRDSDIQTAWDTCTMRTDDGTFVNYTPRARKPSPPPPPQHPNHVRNLIDAGGGMGCSDAVRELSPCLDWIGKPPTVQTALFMRAAFRPDEVLHVFRDDEPTAGKIGVNLRTAADWVQAVERGEPLRGDLVVANPFTGNQGATRDCKPSFIAKDCLAAFPFAVIEMDDAKYAFGAQGDVARGLQMQCAFWRGFILKSELAPALVALTYSGGKSIHGLLNVEAATLDGWEKARDQLVALFASDPQCLEAEKKGKPDKAYPYRIDVQALEPRQGVRVPGVRRFDNRRAQTLLFLNPLARAGTMWRECVTMPPPPIDPNGKPPCGTAYNMRTAGGSMCGVCSRLTDCPFADPGATAGTTLKGGAKC